MKLSTEACRERFARARVARLATVDMAGRPHLVPVCCALVGNNVVTAVDQKPKSTTELRRLRNIADNEAVSLLCDHYSDDWTQLWWVRIDGVATITGGAQRPAALAALLAKYPQYRDDPPRGPVISVAIERWTGWAYQH
ncbi:MAG: TIGR03668 family PPOX class F420-dependent oxidoreductase [Actinomycetota bacterium]|nr:TIGR03668 family PPOX class F420-dependent oxidoreductase [Actinomycetota bacterium]